MSSGHLTARQSTATPNPFRSGPGRAVGLALAGGYLVALGVATQFASYETWRAMVLVPLLLGVGTAAILRLMRDEPDRWIVGVVLVALAVKLAVAMVRFRVASGASDVDDSILYHLWGEWLSQSYRELDFGLPFGRGLVGTGFVRVLTGLLYSVTGPTLLGGYLVFSWLGFWGLYLFRRAFDVAVPGGDRRRYAVLVMLAPTLVYWPSVIGKDAWMQLALGVCALGAARLLTLRRGGYTVLVLGLLATALVRPHITALVVAGVFAAYLLRRPPADHPSVPFLTGPVLKGAGVAGLLVLGIVSGANAAHHFDVDVTDVGAVDQLIESNTDRSPEAGSTFGGARPRSVLDYPKAGITVLARPFPWEGTDWRTVVAGLEGLALVTLLALSWRRLAALPRTVRRAPYVVLAVVFSVLFLYAFSSIDTFGNLVRQRAQALPFVLVLAALPSSPLRHHREAGQAARPSSSA